MRKLICIVLILCLAFALSANVLAAEFANMYTLLQYWDENGFPDDVGSIYSTDGSPYNLTVQLVGDDIEARADEIRAMLDDPSTVTFEKGTYTDKQLHEISSEIAETYMTDGSGIQSVAVGWGSNGKGFGASGKEMRVVVKADDEKAIELAQALGNKYGEAVFVEVSRSEPETVDEPDLDAESAEETPEEAEPSDGGLISPAPAGDEVPAAQEDAAASAPEPEEKKLSDDTLYTIMAIAMGALAAFLIIYLRRRKKKMR